MHTEKFPLSPPDLQELAEKLKSPLAANYEHFTVEVQQCPDLRGPPFHLATESLCGDEKIADVGGQPNLFPRPRLGCKYALNEIAQAMEMAAGKGSLIGAGAGPFHIIGQNCELAPNISWKHGFENVDNQTHFIRVPPGTHTASVEKHPSMDCALMVNLYGSSGDPGPVLKITARKRKGSERSFTECIRKSLHSVYGDSWPISLGGVFLIKSGKSRFHVMPDFPPEQKLPFESREQLENWLTFHNFDAPIICLSVLHSADPHKLGLRMEHTHCFSVDGSNAGGHYHYDIDGVDEDIEYEAYFNTAKSIYRIEKPAAP